MNIPILFRTWLAAGLLRVLAVGLMLAAPSLVSGQTEAEAAKARQSAAALLHVAHVDLVTLDFDRQPGLPLFLEVPLAGEWVTLDLSPWSVRDPQYRLIEQIADGTYRDAKAGPINTLRGEIRGQPGSLAAGGIMPDGLYATILLPDGERYWIQPVEGRVDGVPPGTHAIYHGDDIIADGVHQCGNNANFLSHDDSDPGEDNDGLRGGTRYIAQVGCDADYEYFSLYGSTSMVEARINLVINTMNLQYERDVDISHSITAIIVRTGEADPYSATNAYVLLPQFENHWNSSQGGVARDVAHLFTGKELDGNIIGLAEVGVICTNLAYGLVQSDFDLNFGSATDLSAHELGHNWNAAHCACASPAFTMNPFITAINRFGGPAGENGSTDIAAMTAHRNSRAFFPFFCLGFEGGGTIPGNDLCTDAVAIGSGLTAFSTVGASDDGTVACVLPRNDVWYTYTAPCDGNVVIDTCDSNFDTVLVAYDGGCNPGPAQQVGCNDDTAGCGLFGIRGSEISFNAVRGTVYRLRVGGFSGATGSGVLNIFQSFCPPPSNDNCGDAQALANGESRTFTTINATTDGPVENANCNFFGDGQILRDVWFIHVAACTGLIRVSLCASDYDTDLAVYAGCPSGPNQAITCNDDGGPVCGFSFQSSLDFSASEGIAYFIRIGGFAGEVGSGTVRVESLACPRPSNDECFAAIDVSAGITDAPFPLYGATNDGAASCGASETNRDVWFSFTAPAIGGTLTVRTCGTHDTGGVDSSTDTVASIHSACPGIESNQVGGFSGCNDDIDLCPGLDSGVLRDSSVTAHISGFQTVLIRISHFAGVLANQPFMLSTVFSPDNDFCSNAFDISSGVDHLSVELAGATNDGLASCDGPGRDVWFQYTAACAGALTVRTCGTHDSFGVDTGIDTILSIHSGCPGSAANTLDCNDDSGVCPGEDVSVLRDSSVSVTFSDSQTVLIRLSPYFDFMPAQRRVLMTTSFVPAIPANDACASAQNIGDGSFPYCNLGASTDGPADCFAIQRDVWFRYTAPCTGQARANLCGSTGDPVLVVYTPNCGSLNQLACNDDSGPACDGLASSADFSVIAGQRYRIRIGGFNGGLATGNLVMSCVSPCPCDWNQADGLDSQDFFDFITDFFNADADFNGVDGTDSQDYFDFINCFANGCP